MGSKAKHVVSGLNRFTPAELIELIEGTRDEINKRAGKGQMVEYSVSPLAELDQIYQTAFDKTIEQFSAILDGSNACVNTCLQLFSHLLLKDTPTGTRRYHEQLRERVDALALLMDAKSSSWRNADNDATYVLKVLDMLDHDDRDGLLALAREHDPIAYDTARQGY